MTVSTDQGSRRPDDFPALPGHVDGYRPDPKVNGWVWAKSERLPDMDLELVRELLLWATESVRERVLTRNGPAQIDGYMDPVTGEPLVRIWRQSEWHCGTSCCQAGAAVQARGWQPGMPGGSSIFKPIGGGDSIQSDVETEAIKILGLTVDEALAYFTAGNTLENLYAYAHNFAAARGLTLDLPYTPDLPSDDTKEEA